MKFAILEVGSQQVRAEEGSIITVNRMPQNEGDVVDFPAMLISDDDNVYIGRPIVEGSKVSGTIFSHERSAKPLVFKYKPKKRYRRKQGHRQEITKIKIDEISIK